MDTDTGRPGRGAIPTGGLMTVATLLEQSRAAHLAYRKLAAKYPKPSGAVEHLRTALALREQAHSADPTHADPSWSEDTASHEALMAFYRQQTGAVSPNGASR